MPDGGTYTTACKPGMVGDGIRAPFTVTGSATRSVDENTQLAEATAGYQRYVTSQIEALVPKTQEFVDAVKAGDVETAKTLFPIARTYWERIEPVAESFGDIDPKIDGREDDERDPGVQFTGYHRLEKDLWVDGLQPDSPAIADQLMADINDLRRRVQTVELTPGAAGQRGEGAARRGRHRQDHRRGGPLLAHRPVGLQGQRRGLAGRGGRAAAGDRREGPGARPGARRALRGGRRRCWRSYRVGDGYQLYTELTPDDIRKMSEAVDALGEPVSQVAGVVTS